MKIRMSLTILLCLLFISCNRANQNNLPTNSHLPEIEMQTDSIEYIKLPASNHFPDTKTHTDRIERIAYYDTGGIKFITFRINHHDDDTNKRFITSIGFFETGEVSSIRYFRSIPIKNDTVYIQFYKSGQPQLIHTTVKDSMDYPRLSTWFFENGQIHSQGIYDSYDGMWIMAFGLWEEFDSLGNLVRTTYYHPDEYGKDFIIIREYSDGELISERKYNNFVQHETDPIRKR